MFEFTKEQLIEQIALASELRARDGRDCVSHRVYEQVIKPLVEALEKAHLEISSANRMMKAQDQELITRRQRISSLESRTVTVKPPQRKTVDPYCYDQGVNCKALGYNEALVDFRINLAAAGIQVIEGEA
ncbi:MAG: hypothetical protein ACRCZ6_13970 [Kluyvera sp.]|uniref:hypothetical protein n=1 Tax=Kluyvera sp. TaxID=1538228 RepID=UPI003F31C890